MQPQNLPGMHSCSTVRRAIAGAAAVLECIVLCMHPQAQSRADCMQPNMQHGTGPQTRGTGSSAMQSHAMQLLSSLQPENVLPRTSSRTQAWQVSRCWLPLSRPAPMLGSCKAMCHCRGRWACPTGLHIWRAPLHQHHSGARQPVGLLSCKQGAPMYRREPSQVGAGW